MTRRRVWSKWEQDIDFCNSSLVRYPADTGLTDTPKIVVASMHWLAQYAPVGECAHSGALRAVPGSTGATVAAEASAVITFTLPKASKPLTKNNNFL
jgi:hypothetical protein